MKINLHSWTRCSSFFEGVFSNNSAALSVGGTNDMMNITGWNQVHWLPSIVVFMYLFEWSYIPGQIQNLKIFLH